MSEARRAFVALGGNVGDRLAHLEAALAGLAATPGVRLAAASAAFQNPAVGGPPQPDYWNAVAEVVTTLPPVPLWRRLRAIEDERGRVRGERYGPRTLDLDLLAFGDAVTSERDLTLPHPHALERAFTLLPWAEIAPHYVVPGTDRTVLAHEAAAMGRDPAGFRSMRRVAVLSTPPAPASGGEGSAAGRRPVVLPDRAALDAFRAKAPDPVGFLPTLGALHEGHASHARRARAECATVVASVFVNPLQFGPKEDFSRYPRTFEADLDLLGREGCDAVYAPEASDLYPPGFSTHVEVDGVSSVYEGAARPGHFRGVATVVAKLLLRVRPDRAYFGQKDAQQCVVVRRMAADIDLPGEIVVGPTVRDVDGLALSSRNRYLSPEDRRRALALPEALSAVRLSAAAGERDGQALLATAKKVLEAGEGVVLDYAALLDPDTYEPVARLESKPALVVATVKVGGVRLLDNRFVVAP